MKKEDYEKLKFEFGGKYLIKDLPKDVLPTWKTIMLRGKIGEVVKMVEKPYEKKKSITLKIENFLTIFDGNSIYLTFEDEDLFLLEKVDESKKKPKKIQPTVEFDFGTRITTLKLDKVEIKVKAHEDDTFDEEKGILLCIAKLYGYSYEDIKKLVKNAKRKEGFKFSVGSFVSVVNKGHTYDTYREFVKKYAPRYINNYKDCELPKEERQYIIIGSGEHKYNGLPLYVIKDLEDNVFVIGEEGIKEI